jgi:ABC-type polysaccharide/polyol phosphate transport system ATPase subunit
MHVITCQNVSKIFRRHTGQKLIREHVAGWFRPRSRAEESFYALKNVSFTVNDGESVGIVGSNGAGKSTLLGLVTGLAKPDTGSLEVKGRVAALLELGAGFHPDLTGAENVRLNAALLGFTKKQTVDLFDSIVDFSGIGDFIDEPLRTYSSGMVVRLAFSVAINVDPDILIVDEVLAVGDQEFQAKCHDRIRQLREAKKTFLCVSHSPNILLQFCDQGIWLDHGEVILKGNIRDVIEAYQGHAAVSDDPAAHR